MSNALVVFNALRTFDRPASRGEIERESGLDYDEVHEALRTLARHGVLIKLVDAPRRRGLYQLVEDARKPDTARGRYERDEVLRQQAAAAMRGRRALAVGYSAAAPPSHAAAPGVLRTVVKGRIESQRTVDHSSAHAIDVCALSHFWATRTKP